METSVGLPNLQESAHAASSSANLSDGLARRETLVTVRSSVNERTKRYRRPVRLSSRSPLPASVLRSLSVLECGIRRVSSFSADRQRTDH